MSSTMKVLCVCLFVLHVLVSSKATPTDSSKLALLTQLLEYVEKRDNVQTGYNNEKRYSQFTSDDDKDDDDDDDDKDDDDETTMTYEVSTFVDSSTSGFDSTSGSPPTSGHSTSDKDESSNLPEVTTSSYYETSSTSFDTTDLTLPPPSISPREYMRHVIEGMCVMLKYLEGKEKLEAILKINKHGDTRDTDHECDNEVNCPDKFPWKQAEAILDNLCSVIDVHNSEQMKLAESFIMQMAEHGAKSLGA